MMPWPVEAPGERRLRHGWGAGLAQQRVADRRRGVEVCADELRQTHRAFEVQLAAPLLKVVEARKRLRRVHQNHFDEARRERRVGLEKRRRARHDRRRHRSAAHVHLLLGEGPRDIRVERRVLRHQIVVLCLPRDDLVAGRGEVGLDEIVEVPDARVIRPEAARGAARAEGRDLVVGALVRAEGVDRADRDDRGVVARRVNPPVESVARAVLAFVTRSGDDHDPGCRQAAHGHAERVGEVRIDGCRAEAQVDHFDVVDRVGVVGQHPVERAQDRRGRASVPDAPSTRSVNDFALGATP